MTSIFNIQQDQLELEAQLAEILTQSEGEITDEAQEVLDQLQFTEDNFLSKVDSTINFIKYQESQVDTITKEIKRLTKLKTYSENAITRNKENISNAMKQFGYEDLDRGLYKLSFRTSRPAPNIYGEVPKQFKSFEKVEVIDKAAVKKFLLENGPQEWGESVIKSNLQIR